METKPVQFVPHGADSPEVVARLQVMDDLAQARVERINARLAPHIERLNARLGALLRSPLPPNTKIREFYRTVDEIMSFNGDDVACKRGCSHCCHICVLITEDEARYIGSKIGIKPKNAKERKNAQGFDWGYHNPCTFLKDGECSIYEHRPLACRVQINVDIDALLCELSPPESKPVPYMNNRGFHMAFLQMLGVPRRVPKLADIRDWFPRSK